MRNNRIRKMTSCQRKKESYFRQHSFLLLILVLLFSGMGLVNTSYNFNLDMVSNETSFTHESTVNEQGPIEEAQLASRTLELKSFNNKQNIKVKKENSILINDPAMSKKWGLKVTDSLKAWNVSKGSRDIVVAVIDTGVDSQHEDLKNNLWVNAGEIGIDVQGKDKRTNGIDDDGNGFVDDVNGWNFVGKNNDLTDNHGHGTHIAGIIGAEGGNKKGIIGVSPHVSLMILKYFDPKATGMNNLSNTIYALKYAIQQGAHIINYSGGGLEPSKEEKRLIELARKKGILVVAAAGNERSNSDVHAYYPADYDLDNIISVTAINQGSKINGGGGNILPSSNYGVKSVDIAAPGNAILSTVPGGKYQTMTGTSQATAFVSGVAALLMAHNRDLKTYQVAKILNQTGDIEPSLDGKTQYKKRINSYRALTMVVQGAGVNGAIAQNTAAIKPGAFSISAQDDINRGISSSFGKSLLNNIHKSSSRIHKN